MPQVAMSVTNFIAVFAYNGEGLKWESRMDITIHPMNISDRLDKYGFTKIIYDNVNLRLDSFPGLSTGQNLALGALRSIILNHKIEEPRRPLVCDPL